jgi:AraC-like DNA-binding protein
MSFNSETRTQVLFEKSDSGSSESVPVRDGHQGRVVDADTAKSKVDFNGKNIRIRFKLLENALPGVWYLTAYGVDPTGDRSNCISQGILVSAPRVRWYTFVVTGIVFLVVVTIVALRNRAGKTAFDPTIPDTQNLAYVKLSGYVHAHLHDKITVENAVSELGLGKRAFHQLVRSANVGTFTRLVNKIKVEESKALLGQRKSVTEVSFALGFENPGYFSKIFKEIEGVAPKEFQQKLA